MTYVSSFDPVEGRNARILILGSMPGVASLEAGQYYAHPRNAFWPIIGTVLGVPPEASYAQRIDVLRRSRIALWDVLQNCVRPGSLDANIDADSATPNDIEALLNRQPRIDVICFNGTTAEKYFKRHVAPRLTNRHIRCVRLPSTSPAHAGMSFEKKVAAWRAAIRP